MGSETEKMLLSLYVFSLWVVSTEAIAGLHFLTYLSPMVTLETGTKRSDDREPDQNNQLKARPKRAVADSVAFPFRLVISIFNLAFSQGPRSTETSRGWIRGNIMSTAITTPATRSSRPTRSLFPLSHSPPSPTLPRRNMATIVHSYSHQELHSEPLLHSQYTVPGSDRSWSPRPMESTISGQVSSSPMNLLLYDASTTLSPASIVDAASTPYSPIKSDLSLVMIAPSDSPPMDDWISPLGTGQPELPSSPSGHNVFDDGHLRHLSSSSQHDSPLLVSPAFVVPSNADSRKSPPLDSSIYFGPVSPIRLSHHRSSSLGSYSNIADVTHRLPSPLDAGTHSLPISPPFGSHSYISETDFSTITFSGGIMDPSSIEGSPTRSSNGYVDDDYPIHDRLLYYQQDEQMSPPRTYSDIYEAKEHSLLKTASPEVIFSSVHSLSPVAFSSDNSLDGGEHSAVFTDELIDSPALGSFQGTKRGREPEDEEAHDGDRKKVRKVSNEASHATTSISSPGSDNMSVDASDVEGAASSDEEEQDAYSEADDAEDEDSDDGEFVPGNDVGYSAASTRSRRTRNRGFKGTPSMALKSMFDAHGGEPAPLSSAPVAAPRKIVGKSSRGRKVPTLQQHIAESTVGGSGVVGGRKVKVAKTNGGKRNFVCNIDGCGKCFLRSEHLKRHVRSLHSLEKPHMCPHDGCGKSFSRRDNLAQHCRVHL